MTAEIVKPWGVVPSAAAAEPEVLALLEEVLEQARHGEVAAVAIAMIDPGGFVRTRTVSGSRFVAELVGAVASMQDDIMRWWKRGSVPE